MMSEEIQYPYLCRYLDATDLFDVLVSKRLILRDPKYWDDKNDCFLIQQYAEALNLKNIFVSCFTTQYDAYHFWKIYADRPSGVCVKFKTQKIREAIERDKDSSRFHFQPVEYRTLRNLTQSEVDIKSYPFIKRVAFKAEEEVRLFFEETKADLPYRTLCVELDSIEEIVFSPLIRDEYVKNLSCLINKIIPSNAIKMRKSTILQSAAWQRQMLY